MELPILVDRTNADSMQEQIAGQLADMMLDGRLPAGSRLPSTRSLAKDLRVSRNVALAAYDELFAEGYIEGRQGSGTYVVHDLPVQPQPEDKADAAQPRWLEKQAPPTVASPARVARMIDFRPGQPSVEPLSDQVWRKLWREMAGEQPPDAYGPPEGYPELREAVARYVGRSRGITCSPDSVVITSGSLQAVNLIAQAAVRNGDGVAFEEPGYPTSRAALQMHGARIVPVPVDRDGLDVACLDTAQPAPILAYVTPSHQYPTGARMSVVRRLALLEWARRTDSLIVEDDYDSELRFDATPLPALASLEQASADGVHPTGPRHVAYIGTFSKTLTPALRVGYVIAPAVLRDRLIRIKHLTDFQTSWPLQRMLTAFLDDNSFNRHIRRMRRHYAEKRELLGSIFEPLAGIADLRGLEAGLHAYLEIDPAVPCSEVERAARARGVQVATIDEYFHGSPTRNGILLGYGGLTLDQIERGGTILAGILQQCSRAC
ncbi:MAG: PLP-dependent aminotransferase family protein [Thermomicrobiales bacterium]